MSVCLSAHVALVIGLQQVQGVPHLSPKVGWDYLPSTLIDHGWMDGQLLELKEMLSSFFITAFFFCCYRALALKLFPLSVCQQNQITAMQQNKYMF